jgi:leader peptidase (prepilin peptidase)/N-methyltransferase
MPEAIAAAARQPIDAWKHPAALAIAVAVAALVLVRYGLGAQGIIGACFGAVLVALSAIDLDQRILPNRIVLPATAAILVAQIIAFPDQALEWVLAALGAAAFLALPLLVSPGGVGMGDVKLGLLMGAGLGVAVIDAIFYAALAALVLAGVLIARHGRSALKMGFPFGPFLSFGAIVALFAGHHVG